MNRKQNPKQLLETAVKQQLKRVLSEDYARGIPDFALSQVASDAAENLKRHLKRHIQTVSQDPAKQRQMHVAAAQVLRDLESEMKDLLEDKLMQFIRLT